MVQSARQSGVAICAGCIASSLDVIRAKDRELFEHIVAGVDGLQTL